jgi:hypothetical protein
VSKSQYGSTSGLVEVDSVSGEVLPGAKNKAPNQKLPIVEEKVEALFRMEHSDIELVASFLDVNTNALKVRILDRVASVASAMRLDEMYIIRSKGSSNKGKTSAKTSGDDKNSGETVERPSLTPNEAYDRYNWMIKLEREAAVKLSKAKQDLDVELALEKIKTYVDRAERKLSDLEEEQGAESRLARELLENARNRLTQEVVENARAADEGQDSRRRDFLTDGKVDGATEYLVQGRVEIGAEKTRETEGALDLIEKVGYMSQFSTAGSEPAVEGASSFEGSVLEWSVTTRSFSTHSFFPQF